MIDAVYFMRIYEELINRDYGDRDVVTFSEAREKFGIPSMYKHIESAPGYNHRLDVTKNENGVVYKLKDKSWWRS